MYRREDSTISDFHFDNFTDSLKNGLAVHIWYNKRLNPQLNQLVLLEDIGFCRIVRIIGSSADELCLKLEPYVLKY